MVVAVAPFSHIMGFMVTGVLPLCAGATLITMPRFDAGRLLDLVEEHRVTVLAVPPPVMAALAAAPPERDLSSVELVVCGGAPLSAERHAAVAARLPHAAVGQGYGLTETAVGITGPDRDTGTVPGSVGRALPDTELRVVDGELWARGPQNTAGYLGRPDATAALIDHDGWLHTGDAGRIDADGNVWIVDRLKELIKVNGHQVAPAELEALLATHPLIADAAVVGRPGRRARRDPGRHRRGPRRARPRRPHGLDRRARRALQAHPRGAPRGRDPAHAGRQDPAPAAARHRLSARKPRSSSWRACLPGSGESSSTTPRRTCPRRALATRQRPAASV